MGTYVNNNIVTLGTEYDYDNAVAEIGALLGVGPREDEMYRLADICKSSSINKWAKWKPVSDTTLWNLFANKPYGYRGINNDCNISIPIITQSDFNAGALSTLSKIQGASKPTYIIPTEYPSRLRDFDGYNHASDINAEFGWPTGTLYIQSTQTLSLYVASFYTNTGSKNAGVLSLVDLMQRFTNKINWTDINNDTSYGYLGVLLFYYNVVDDTMSMALRSHSLLINASDQRSITLSLSALNSDDSGLAAIKKGTTCYLVPCICNYNTESKWVGVGAGSSVNYLECAILPFSGYTNKAYSVRAGSAAYPDEQLLTCTSVYGGTITNNGANGNPIAIEASSPASSTSAYFGITLKLTQAATSATTYYYRVWNMVSNTVVNTGSITFPAGASANMTIQYKDIYHSTANVISGKVEFSTSSSFTSYTGYILLS